MLSGLLIVQKTTIVRRHFSIWELMWSIFHNGPQIKIGEMQLYVALFFYGRVELGRCEASRRLKLS